MNGSEMILKDLDRLVTNSIARYNSEFIWQDVRLTDEFKLAFANCVSNSGGVIKYHECTAVVTTSKNKDIFVPNQWFVIASYVIELCEELKKYQSYYFKVADQLNEDYEDYAKSLRGCAEGDAHKDRFIHTAIEVISDIVECGDFETQSAAYKLWRFCTNYKWWGGQKTIDRGDFMHSTILSILNLVAASQGYVADIVGYYLNDSSLRDLVTNVYDFTVDLDLPASNLSVVTAVVSGYDQRDEVTETLGEPSFMYGNQENGGEIIVSESTSHKIKISSASFGKFNDKKKR